MKKIRVISFTMALLLVTIPAFALSSCGSTSQSNKDGIDYKITIGAPTKTELAQHHASDFDKNYIWEHWIIFAKQANKDTYKEKYHVPEMKITANDSLGTLDIQIPYDNRAYVTDQGAIITSSSVSYQGFNTGIIPVDKYHFNWIGPSTGDKLKKASDTSFNQAYIEKHWMTIDQKYYDEKHKIAITKSNINNTLGTMDITIGFDTEVLINGSSVKSTSETLSGFVKVPPKPDVYTMASIEPSGADKQNAANDLLFDATYAMNHWILLDQNYVKKYGNPVINLNHDTSKGTITMAVTFATKVIFNNVSTAGTSVAFSGFYVTPVSHNNYFKYNAKNIPTSSFMKSQVDQMSLENKIENFIVFPADSSLIESDISNISITTSGQVGKVVNANLKVTFNKAVHLDNMTSATHTEWNTNFTLIPTTTVVPHLKFLASSSIDKNQLPSQVTESYIYSNILNIVDDYGNKLNPNTYVKRLSIHPNDEGGFLSLSVVFNDLTTRLPPINCAPGDEIYYQAPSYYFNTNISGFKTNGNSYYAASGYITDTSIYSGRHSFNLSDMDIVHHNNYNDYILAFMAPDSFGHITWWDVNSDFGSIGLAQPVPGSEYRPQVVSGKKFHPGMEPFMKGTQKVPQTTYNGGMVGQLNAVKSYTGATTGFSIGGATLSYTFSGIVASASSRSNLITDIIHIVEANGFDSIDIDWEYPYSNDRTNLVTFMKELRAAFDANVDPDVQNTKITLAMTDDPGKIRDGIDGANLMKYIDYFHVMTYDMHVASQPYFAEQAMLYADYPLVQATCVKPVSTMITHKPDGTPVTYHINNKYYSSAQWQQVRRSYPDNINVKPYSGNDSMLQLEAMGVPSHQITIGAAFYGRGWKVTPNMDSPIKEIPGYMMEQKGMATGDWGQQFGSYSWIIDQTKKETGWQLVKNYVTQTTWYYNKAQGIIWSTDTPWSVNNKVNFVKQEDLGGILVWEMAGEWDGSQANLDMSDHFQNNLSGPKTNNVQLPKDINIITNIKWIN